MDYSYFGECHAREFHFLSAPTGTIKTVPPALPDRRYQATFKVSCQHHYQNWILRQDSTVLEFVSEVQTPFLTESIRYYPDKTVDSKYLMRDIVYRGHKDFSAVNEGFDVAKALSDVAWDIIVERMPLYGNQVSMDFSFAVVHKHVFDENLAVDRVMQEVGEPAMVPATEASIRSLKSKVIECDSDESCRICLEDFQVGCQGVLAMPCSHSHLFHKDCIETWLRSSHYCPVCRYQMPTD